MNLKRFGLLAALSGACLVGFTSHQIGNASMNNKQVRPECNNGPVMFGHRNFEGRVVYISRSYSNLSSIDFNDKAGSVCLPSGWTVELFNHENYNRTGTPTAVLNGPDSLSFFEGSGLNNTVSSVRVYRNGQIQ